MIFFDEQNPNKYNHLKKVIRPNDLFIKGELIEFWRCGEKDGSYVIPSFYQDCAEPFSILSYGIGSDPNGVSFEISIMGEENLNRIFAYDGSIDCFPVETNEKISFSSEYLTPENFPKHVDKLSTKNNILKMDIEGNEYSWLTDDNSTLLADNFDIFTVELHSLIEEVPEGWILESPLGEIKQNKEIKKAFFNLLSYDWLIWHIHGNNHGPRYVDFPDSLEITFVNKKVFDEAYLSNIKFPIDGLDEANYNGRNDYVLDWWV